MAHHLLNYYDVDSDTWRKNIAWSSMMTGTYRRASEVYPSLVATTLELTPAEAQVAVWLAEVDLVRLVLSLAELG